MSSAPMSISSPKRRIQWTKPIRRRRGSSRIREPTTLTRCTPISRSATPACWNVDLDADNDATTLENLDSALMLIKECNDLRAGKSGTAECIRESHRDTFEGFRSVPTRRKRSQNSAIVCGLRRFPAIPRRASPGPCGTLRRVTQRAQHDTQSSAPFKAHDSHDSHVPVADADVSYV